MTYEQIRARAVNGDVLGVKGKGLINKIIRAFSDDWSHVGVFVWHGTGLWLYEFTLHGYMCTPASQWFELNKGKKIYFGRAPVTVRSKPEIVLQAASSFRASHILQHYGLLTYPKILWASITKKDYPTTMKVCSTFVQYVWEEAGFDLKETADPGDIMR